MKNINLTVFIIISCVLYMVFLIPFILLDHREPFTYKDFLKIIPSFMVSVATTYIAFQQYLLAKQQKDISSQQKNIAANKLKLELFEKKYEIYEIHLNMALWVSKIKLEKEDKHSSLPEEFDEEWKRSEKYEENFVENEDKLISLGEQVRFLFDEEMYSFLSGIRGQILTLETNIQFIRALKKEEKKEKENPLSLIDNSTELSLESALKVNRSLNNEIQKFYEKELPERMMPYLKMPEDISKDEI